MLTLALLALVALPPADRPPLAHGKATHYAPGVMQAVVQNRTRWQQLHPGRGEAGYIALADCKHLDSLVWLDHPAGTIGPLLVADCAASKHGLPTGFAADLSYELAVRLDTVGRPLPGVTVWRDHSGENRSVPFSPSRLHQNISPKGSDLDNQHTLITLRSSLPFLSRFPSLVSLCCPVLVYDIGAVPFGCEVCMEDWQTYIQASLQRHRTKSRHKHSNTETQHRPTVDRNRPGEIS